MGLYELVLEAADLDKQISTTYVKPTSLNKGVKAVNFRNIYKKAFGSIPKDKEGRTYDVHHIDGDRRNNEPWNLIAVPVLEHFFIHWAQREYRACARIAYRMERSHEEISELMRQAANQLVREGRHHFLTAENRAQIVYYNRFVRVYKYTEGQRRALTKQLAEGSHPFQRPGQCKVAGRLGGLAQVKRTHVCPHCNARGKGNTMFRHHFDRCKNRKSAV